MAKLNRHLKGWGNYFCFGYPRRLTGGSTPTYGNACTTLRDGGASGPSVRPREEPITGSSCEWDCSCGLALGRDSLRMPAVGNFPPSRMRETFTSGSSRGEWVAPFAGSPSLLLYRYAAHFPRMGPFRESQAAMNRGLRHGFPPGQRGAMIAHSAPSRMLKKSKISLFCLLRHT